MTITILAIIGLIVSIYIFGSALGGLFACAMLALFADVWKAELGCLLMMAIGGAGAFYSASYLLL